MPQPNAFPRPTPRDFAGLRVMVETPAGTTRSGTDRDGRAWSVRMQHDYGYLACPRTGADGEAIDVYLGPDEAADQAYVVHQNEPGTDVYDEDKVMLGFGSEGAARNAYLAHYNRPGFLRSVTAIPMARLRDLISSGGAGGEPVKMRFGRKDRRAAALMSVGGEAPLFYLAPPKGTAFSPTTAVAEGLPRTIRVRLGDDDRDVPVTYLDKVIAVAGRWVNPNNGEVHAIDADRLARWAANFERMRAAGIKVYVCSNHPASPDGVPLSEDNRGYVVRMWAGDAPAAGGGTVAALYATHQLIGEDAVLEALRNDTSIGYSDGYVGTDGVPYGDCIVHNALTPVPVSTGLSAFKQAASRASAAPGIGLVPAAAVGSNPMYKIDCSEEQMSALRKMLPGGDAVQPDTLLGTVVAHLHAISVSDDEDAGGPGAVATMSRAAIHAKAGENRKVLRQQLVAHTAEVTTLREQVKTMSRQVPTPLGEEAEAALLEAADTKFAAAVAAGAIDPATCEQLKGLLVRGADNKINVLTMSRASNPRGNKALALAVAEVLATNKPVPLGSGTPVQAMARNVPGKDDKPAEPANPWLETAEKMYGTGEKK